MWYSVWPDYVNSERACICGAKFKHKLSFLELVGHMLHVTSFPEMVAGKAICTQIDNSGTVVIGEKGRSLRCPLTDTMIRAVNYVAVSLDTRHYIVKIRRCFYYGS